MGLKSAINKSTSRAGQAGQVNHGRDFSHTTVPSPRVANRPQLAPQALKRLVNECQNLHDNVGTFLSGEKFGGNANATVHQAPTNYSALDHFPQTDFSSERHRIFIALSQLAEFYPLGFHLVRLNNQWHCDVLFASGELLELTSPAKVHRGLIPAMGPLSVKCITTDQLIAHLPVKISGVEDCEETLVFRPTEVNAVLVLTQLPRPWLNDMAERTRSFLNRCFLP